ncbi:hypothetical protein BJX99DRAFT_254050 [Aspergillus californicus]
MEKQTSLHDPDSRAVGMIVPYSTPPPYTPSSTFSFKPIVIPQVKKSFSGESASPFTRAYSPILQQYNISRPQFLNFLDGLNEAYIANPVLQATGIAGSVMGMIHPVEIPGMVLEAVSEAGAEATSYFRTRAYLKKASAEIFSPRGLGVKVVGFKDMAEIIGVCPEQLGLMVRRDGGVSGSRDLRDLDISHLQMVIENALNLDVPRPHPRLELLSALGEFVAPLETEDLPAMSKQSNVLKQWNASFASREEKKQSEELDKKYRKAGVRQAEKYQEAIYEAEKKNRAIDRINHKIETCHSNAEVGKDMGRKIDKLESEIGDVRRRRDERTRELMKRGDEDLDRLQQKELDATMKIKWVVIYQTRGASLAERGIERQPGS